MTSASYLDTVWFITNYRYPVNDITTELVAYIYEKDFFEVQKDLVEYANKYQGEPEVVQLLSVS